MICDKNILLLGRTWNHHFEIFSVVIVTLLSATEYLCHRWPRAMFRLSYL